MIASAMPCERSGCPTSHTARGRCWSPGALRTPDPLSRPRAGFEVGPCQNAHNSDRDQRRRDQISVVSLERPLQSRTRGTGVSGGGGAAASPKTILLISSRDGSPARQAARRASAHGSDQFRLGCCWGDPPLAGEPYARSVRFQHSGSGDVASNRLGRVVVFCSLQSKTYVTPSLLPST